MLENKLVKQIVNLRFLKLFGLNSMAEKKNPLKNRLNKYKNIFARKKVSFSETLSADFTYNQIGKFNFY